MRILDEIADAWAWKGVRPRALITQNAFGNVIFTDENGQYWRIRPEELLCEVVATNGEEFERLQSTDEFVEDWTMQELVEGVQSTLGLPTAERCYCLKIPATLGGTYALDNIGTIDRIELISASGHIAKQIDGLSDGTPIRLRVIDRPG
jgi:hypothetical protein